MPLAKCYERGKTPVLLSAVAPRVKQTLTQALYRHPRILSFLKCQAAKGEPDGPAFTGASVTRALQ